MKLLIKSLLHIADKAESLSYWGFYKPKMKKMKNKKLIVLSKS